MSDSMMRLDEALEWVAQDKSTRSTARAARTLVAQAEQIERLQNALRDAEVQRREVWVSNGADIDPQGKVHWDYQYRALLPGDMESPA